MKGYWILALAAFLILGSAAIWMGALNQDEGWYLYAANLTREGLLPYRDFAFTQGPVMPFVYSIFAPIWKIGGILAARCFNFGIGTIGLIFASALAYRLADAERKKSASLVTFLLLGANLYHLYYLAIPKTYALAALFVLVGFYLLTFPRFLCAFAAGSAFALAAGTRFSLALLLPIVAFCLFAKERRLDTRTIAFLIGGAVTSALIFIPCCGESTGLGFFAALSYHSARGGFDATYLIGSLSRLVRWYLPVFVILGLGTFRTALPLLVAFTGVFLLQLVAPFPYDDYQVPIMALLAVYAAVNYVEKRGILLALGLTFATSFGSPLLEKWSTNGQDRFWTIKKDQFELPQLRETARRIESIDPNGKTILTQDLYLAVELDRKVPHGLEMGPFAILTDAEWRQLLAEAPKSCAVAALSGYTFAIDPPVCSERPLRQQLEYWSLLESHYESAFKIESFGQNATPLLVLKRKKDE